MSNTLILRRGTRASLNTHAVAGQLVTGVEYFITDEGRVAIATSPYSYQAYAKEGETGTGSAESKVYAPLTTGQTATVGSITVPEMIIDSSGQVIMVEVT